MQLNWMLRSRCALLLGAAVALQGARAQDNQPAERPAAARRIVAQFDFDKPEPFALPRYWDLAQDGSPSGGRRPGFPVFNGAEHDMSVAYRGEGSVRVFTRGGSTCLRLNSGVVPVFSETEYLVSAKVRTRGLNRARAGLVTRYLDKSGAPVPGSEVRSELIATTADQWHLVSTALRGADASAAYIQIDLDVLQPEQFETPQLGSHQLWPNEFPADAWFDEVTVVQLPRVTISTDSGTNLIRGGPPPTIRVAMRDLTGESVTGRLTIQDAAGRLVDEQTREPASGLVSWSWQPKLTRYGWYRASMELGTLDRRVGGTHVDFIWMPSDRAGPDGVAESAGAFGGDRRRFGIVLEDLPVASRAVLPVLLAQIGSGNVTIPVWEANQNPDSVRDLSMDLVGLVSELKAGWQDVAFALPRMPRELAETTKLEAEDLGSLFARDEKAWLPFLLPLVDKYGQTVRRWQIGRVGAAPALGRDTAAKMARLESLLAKMVPGPVVAVPWPAELAASSAVPGPGVGDLVVSLSYGTPPEAIPLMGAAWHEALGASPPAITAALELLPPDQFSRQESCNGMVKRAVQFWATFCAAGAERPGGVTLVQPWQWPTQDRQQIMPRAELAAYANLVSRLAGRRVVGTMPSSPGVTCYILASATGSGGQGRTGALVAWSDAPASGAAIEAFLGDGEIQAVDMWGNRTPVQRTGGDSRSGESAKPVVHRVPLSDEPTFVENVDVDLARLIASFHLEPDYLAARGGEHELTMVLTNPFSTRAQGRITVLEPGGLSGDPANRDRSWRISPRSSTFALAPGETARIPITVSFSAAEEAGLKPFVADLQLTADREYGSIRVSSALDIRLENVQLEVAYRVAPGGQDLIAEAIVTNRGTAPATMELSGFAAGYPRAKASVADLAPGESATRRFAFPDGVARLRGRRIVVGAQDIETQARVNRSLIVE